MDAGQQGLRYRRAIGDPPPVRGEGRGHRHRRRERDDTDLQEVPPPGRRRVPSMDSNAVVTANGLFNAGYFAGKLGMVTWDDPDYRYTMTQGYLPTLASHGITPIETVYIGVPQQLGALGDMSSAVSSAVAKFKAEGIDHVIIQD